MRDRTDPISPPDNAPYGEYLYANADKDVPFGDYDAFQANVEPPAGQQFAISIKWTPGPSSESLLPVDRFKVIGDILWVTIPVIVLYNRLGDGYVLHRNDDEDLLYRVTTPLQQTHLAWIGNTIIGENSITYGIEMNKYAKQIYVQDPPLVNKKENVR